MNNDTLIAFSTDQTAQQVVAIFQGLMMVVTAILTIISARGKK